MLYGSKIWILTECCTVTQTVNFWQAYTLRMSLPVSQELVEGIRRREKAGLDPGPPPRRGDEECGAPLREHLVVTSQQDPGQQPHYQPHTIHPCQLV